jgi:hypothetical protein
MNVIETKYRLTGVAEDLAHEDSKLAVIEIESRLCEADRDRLRSASWHILRAVMQLRSVSLTSTGEDLSKILEASIDGVRERRLSEINAETEDANGH